MTTNANGQQKESFGATIKKNVVKLLEKKVYLKGSQWDGSNRNCDDSSVDNSVFDSSFSINLPHRNLSLKCNSSQFVFMRQ